MGSSEFVRVYQLAMRIEKEERKKAAVNFQKFVIFAQNSKVKIDSESSCFDKSIGIKII